jgi:hypothetical protein
MTNNFPTFVACRVLGRTGATWPAYSPGGGAGELPNLRRISRSAEPGRPQWIADAAAGQGLPDDQQQKRNTQ